MAKARVQLSSAMQGTKGTTLLDIQRGVFDTEAQARCPGEGACVFVAKIRGTCVFKIPGFL